MNRIPIYITFLCFFALVIPNAVYSSEWYEGGTLHQATVKTWKQSSYSNRLATAGDWFVSITKSHNQSLKRKMDSLSATQYLSALKQFAVQLEKCVSDTASLSSEGRVVSNPNDKIAKIASICYISMYGVK
ncbi:MAG: hypothetical protein PHP23_16030 [Desulfobacterales bacterium]|nr:hypothetical protein [Desulfobacterales bacterium]MDD4392168.1 hypothetical protein [Desulfobacterales bacterium]